MDLPGAGAHFYITRLSRKEKSSGTSVRIWSGPRPPVTRTPWAHQAESRPRSEDLKVDIAERMMAPTPACAAFRRRAAGAQPGDVHLGNAEPPPDLGSAACRRGSSPPCAATAFMPVTCSIRGSSQPSRSARVLMPGWPASGASSENAAVDDERSGAVRPSACGAGGRPGCLVRVPLIQANRGMDQISRVKSARRPPNAR